MKNVPSGIAKAKEIPADILKNSEFYLSELTKCFNKTFNDNKFPDTLKLSNIVPIFKKLNPSDKTNFKSLSLYCINLYCIKSLKI